VSSSLRFTSLYRKHLPPYKLGTFERQGKAFVGIVLRDTQVIDFGAAQTAVRTPVSTITPHRT
jgi:hypothetical protein